jgi:hypothetical protein
MTQLPHSSRPPRLAAYLVELFACTEQSESVLGDLHEEFLDLASGSGVVTARRWYWRQSAKTIFHLVGAAFRTAPLSLAGVVLLGFLLERFSFGFPERLMVLVLRTQRPYSNLHYGFYAWLVTYGIPLVAIIQTILVGCITAALAKGREMVATIVLTFLSAAPLGLLLLNTGGPWSPFAYSWPFVIMELVNLLWIIPGGVIVREIRSALARRVSRT